MRKSVWIAFVAAVAALGVGLYVTYSARPAKAQGITLDRTLVALLPANTVSLVGVNVEHLKRTALYRHFEEESRKTDRAGRNHFDEFVAETGFDPRRDVQELLIAAWAETGATEPQWVAVGRGSFNVANLSRQLREKKATVESYRGLEVFGPDGRRGGKHEGGFAFLDDRTALAGTRTGVLAAIDRKLGGGPSLLANSSLLNRAQTISGSSQVWAISDNPGQVVARALPNDASAPAFARIFSSMQNTTFAVDLMNGLDLRAAGVCRTAQDAKTLGDAARGVVALGRLTASQKDPELMTLFDGIQVEERNSELNIAVRVDSQNFEKLLEKTRSKHRGMRGVAAE